MRGDRIALRVDTSTAGSGTDRPARRPRPGVVVVNGDCDLPNVSCEPSRPGSCSGNASQTAPRATIKVLVRLTATTTQIQTVAFQRA